MSVMSACVLIMFCGLFCLLLGLVLLGAGIRKAPGLPIALKKMALDCQYAGYGLVAVGLLLAATCHYFCL